MKMIRNLLLALCLVQPTAAFVAPTPKAKPSGALNLQGPGLMYGNTVVLGDRARNQVLNSYYGGYDNYYSPYYNGGYYGDSYQYGSRRFHPAESNWYLGGTTGYRNSYDRYDRYPSWYYNSGYDYDGFRRITPRYDMYVNPSWYDGSYYGNNYYGNNYYNNYGYYGRSSGDWYNGRYRNNFFPVVSDQERWDNPQGLGRGYSIGARSYAGRW